MKKDIKEEDPKWEPFVYISKYRVPSNVRC